MQIIFSTLLPVAAIVAIVAAAPTELEARSSTDQCNTGPIQCCTNTYSQYDSTYGSIFGYLGIPLGSTQSLIGLGCSPLTAVGKGTGATCTAQPVCCTGNTFNGLVNIGCSPINVNA